MQETETEQPVGDTSRYSLTCLDKSRKPNPRACLRIHSSHYCSIRWTYIYLLCNTPTSTMCHQLV
jgi:hypothetical protein